MGYNYHVYKWDGYYIVCYSLCRKKNGKPHLSTFAYEQLNYLLKREGGAMRIRPGVLEVYNYDILKKIIAWCRKFNIKFKVYHVNEVVLNV